MRFDLDDPKRRVQKLFLQFVAEIRKPSASPRTRFFCDEIREPRNGLVLDRIEQFKRSLVELVQGIDALLAVDDLETFTAKPGSFLLDVVNG